MKTLDGHPDLTVPVIQFEKDGAEDAGLIKIDLLGNRSLAVIRDAIAAVGAHTGHHIDYTSSDPGDDEPTKALFRTGRTMGVFYTESPASRMLCAKSRADTFELLVLNTSIIRPASNRYIKVYLERLHGAPYEPLDPVLRDTLAETFGVMVYQEDVVNVCAAFAGMPLATADGLRKSLSKKRPAKALAGYAEEFFTGAPRARARRRDRQAGLGDGHVVRGLQLLQGTFGVVHPGGAALVLPARALPGGVHGGGAGQRGRVLSPVRLRRGGDADGAHGAAAGRERERVPLHGARAGAADRAAVREGAVGGGGGAARGGRGRRVRREDRTKTRSDWRIRPPAASTVRRPRVDLRARTGLSPSDLRALIKVGALDSIAGGWTRPMMLWLVDSTAECVRSPDDRPGDWFDHLPPAVPVLREYGPERRRREEHAALGFITDAHPMRAPRRRAPALPRSAPAPSSTGTWASTSWPPGCSPPPSRSTP